MTSLPLGSMVALCTAASAAGFVDAIAGGGGLVTVPALMFVVPSPHLVLGTNKGQAVFGAVSSTVSFWRGGGVDRERAPIAFVCGSVGAVFGAILQLRVQPGPLKPIALALLVGAALVVALRPLILRDAHAHQVSAPRAKLVSVALAAGFYDGFFGPGTGSLLIIAFVTLLGDTMLRASGNAKVVNLASNLTSFVIFAARGTILWSVALPMAACSVLGAAVGARVAMKRGDRFVRLVVLAVVSALVVKLAFDLVR